MLIVMGIGMLALATLAFRAGLMSHHYATTGEGKRIAISLVLVALVWWGLLLYVLWLNDPAGPLTSH